MGRVANAIGAVKKGVEAARGAGNRRLFKAVNAKMVKKARGPVMGSDVVKSMKVIKRRAKIGAAVAGAGGAGAYAASRRKK
jgi:hypothetical protein